MKRHHLKIDPEYLDEIETGVKTFELRSTLDRSFRVGDELYLQGYDRNRHAYIGETVVVKVTYILPLQEFLGVMDYSILGIKLIQSSSNIFV